MAKAKASNKQRSTPDGLGSENAAERPSLELSLVGMDIHQDVGRPYTTFIIQARYASESWTVEKRYSEFCTLDQELRKILGSGAGSLPPPLRKSFLLPNAEELEHREEQVVFPKRSTSIHGGIFGPCIVAGNACVRFAAAANEPPPRAVSGGT